MLYELFDRPLRSGPFTGVDGTLLESPAAVDTDQ
jgi:hypothetical protein